MIEYLITTVAGCPVGICIIGGEVVYFDLPYYIGRIVTTSDTQKEG